MKLNSPPQTHNYSTAKEPLRKEALNDSGRENSFFSQMDCS
jgi:hypothetical protein